MNYSDSRIKNRLSSLTSPTAIIGKNLNYFKAQASKLYKLIKQADLIVNSELKTRLANLDNESLLQQPETVKRKQVLHIIALENGFQSWQLLKARVELETALDLSTFFCSDGLGGFLNHWFTGYQEAKDYQLREGGILLPFRDQFFVTNKTYLEKLGFDQSDADWLAMNYDWVCPANEAAKLRVLEKLVANWKS